MERVGIGSLDRSVLHGTLAECGLAALVAAAIGMRIFASAEPGAQSPGARAYLFAVLIAALLPLRRLTDRETEVLGLVGRGLTNDQIAGHLQLSPATVFSPAVHARQRPGTHRRA